MDYGKYLNYLMLKQSDPFIQAKLKQYKETQEPEVKGPSFFDRMERDKAHRSVLQEVMKSVSGPHRQLRSVVDAN